ncbi:Methyltranfer-dom domain-containing protein [Mycena indigotica]|uniref:Methyltranfer-dom domain-containing protein n=1 Tax=Mycena indigotica TaxID=2126181 RepID=A0A8H6T9E9_9AGAR|nr:Methyltranfer-dom domain-containing protein [Mycena indigotica]KAF7312626.1 Methyltranfer-dom domain-containing protein [Mycena indigotica]
MSSIPRINWKAIPQTSWHKIYVGVVLLFTFYLLANTARSYNGSKKFHDVLATPAWDRPALLQRPGTSRLVRTLEGNERRYQETILKRALVIEKEGGKYIVPFPPPRSKFYVLWDFFIPAFTCPFPTYRVGTLVEGGLWVCGLERVLNSRPKPIVYSLNYATPAYSSFEQDMLRRSPGCEIYGFDANATAIGALRWPWGDANNMQSDARVHFNKFGIADNNATQYRSLDSVMKHFGHDFVDILRIDLEGGEFPVLTSMIADNGDKPLPFGQLLLEFHVGWSEDMSTVDKFSKWWERLERAGLRPFYFEISMMDVNNMRKEPAVVYFSFINIRGRHALLDDSLPEYP